VYYRTKEHLSVPYDQGLEASFDLISSANLYALLGGPSPDQLASLWIEAQQVCLKVEPLMVAGRSPSRLVVSGDARRILPLSKRGRRLVDSFRTDGATSTKRTPADLQRILSRAQHR